MLFNLKDVFASHGAKKQLSYSLDMSAISFNGAHPFLTPVKINAFAENRAGLIKLTIDASYDHSGLCDRCGTAVLKHYNKSFEHVVVTELTGDADDEYIEAPDRVVELDAVAESDIILDMPSKFLCKDDCKGLCAVCGKNLNSGSCSCKTGRTDPRLEVLKQLLN
ncbi:MAG: DUF177 domain-containing protein [Clostridiales bacterium]|nr:DUF177 domain-containing protein [Clostridiales bacterium]